jgi:hypothetical protein
MAKPKTSFRETDYTHARKGALVLGTTREGIAILKPHGNPTNFTWKELRAAMSTVRDKARA